MQRRSYFKKNRLRQKMTLQGIADELGMTRSMIGKIENGKADPSWELAQKLEEMFNIPASKLLKRDDDQ
jgi:transcriptional regulator with XRE-family HTH domain